jgi:hypothetical protein
MISMHIIRNGQSPKYPANIYWFIKNKGPIIPFRKIMHNFMQSVELISFLV